MVVQRRRCGPGAVRIRFVIDGLAVRLGALLLGLLLVGIILSVPFLGWLIGFVIFIFGIGSICLWLIGQTPAAQSFGPPLQLSKYSDTRPHRLVASRRWKIASS